MSAAGQQGTTTIVRALVVTGVLISAVLHFDLYTIGIYAQFELAGKLFLVNAAAGVLIGIALQVSRHWIPVLLAFGFGAVTLLFFYIAVIWGIGQDKETLGGTPEIVGQIVEWVVVIGAVVVFLLERRAHDHRAHRATVTG